MARVRTRHSSREKAGAHLQMMQSEQHRQQHEVTKSSIDFVSDIDLQCEIICSTLHHSASDIG